MPSAALNETVTCPSCHELNPSDQDLCVKCGRHLFLKCRACGEVNSRSRSHCRACNHRLRRSPLHALKKIYRRLIRRRVLITVVLFVVAMVLIFLFIQHVGDASGFAPHPAGEGE